MTLSVSGQVCWPPPSMRQAPSSSPERSTQAAPPSANRAVATMLAVVSSSSRKARVQSSMVTKSTVDPGRPAASREARCRPETPPAQPRPKTGTRSTSPRKPMRPSTRASRLGVAMPVEETVTMVSTSLAWMLAWARAALAASTNRASAVSR